jgi:hypothetical protein
VAYFRSTLTKYLRGTLKPVIAVEMPKSLENDSSQTPAPTTPATPVTLEALTSLQDLINQDASGLDEMSKWRLQRHIEKLTNAAKISFAKNDLQKDQIRFLHKVNNEAKVRRSTKSVVLAKGKGKVVKREDPEEARKKRTAKDVGKAKGKGTRDRKRKAPASSSEADVLKPKAKAARKSTATESILDPSVWEGEEQVAPVARMI